MLQRIFSFACTIALLGLVSCEPTSTPSADTWDRGAMLEHLASEYIVPAFAAYSNATDSMAVAAEVWAANPSESNLAELQQAVLQSYEAWQGVSFLDIGPAESISLRNRTNTFPTDTTAVLDHAFTADSSQLPSYQLPSTFDQQGFPALDYLLWARDASFFAAESNAQAHVVRLCADLKKNAEQAKVAWAEYKNSFVVNDGSSASASTNKLANDFIYHVEKELRAGKVGIPAGVFSTHPYPEKVEAYFSGHSKVLFLKSLDAHQAFFNGQSFDGLSSGPSFAAYLDHLGIQDAGTPLSDKINTAFEDARLSATALPSILSDHITADVYAVLDVYDDLQAAVVLMKVDMMQAMNIKVDYVDADGD